MNGSTITLNTVDKIRDVKEEISFAEYKGYLREKTHMFQVIMETNNVSEYSSSSFPVKYQLMFIF